MRSERACALQGQNETQHGIYVKKVVPGGVADADGRLAPGDKLLSVNGVSLLGIMQEELAIVSCLNRPLFTTRCFAELRDGWLAQAHGCRCRSPSRRHSTMAWRALSAPMAAPAATVVRPPK